MPPQPASRSGHGAFGISHLACRDNTEHLRHSRPTQNRTARNALSPGIARLRIGLDPLIVASAIVAQRDLAQLLFGPKWVIATEDSAVRTLASAHGIGTVSFAELRSLIT